MSGGLGFLYVELKLSVVVSKKLKHKTATGCVDRQVGRRIAILYCKYFLEILNVVKQKIQTNTKCRAYMNLNSENKLLRPDP